MKTTFEIWKKKGERLLHTHNSLEQSLETNQWHIGDWLSKGEKDFEDRAYEAAENITGWARGTLYNIVWVVGRFPTSSLRSETTLKWSHFKELARVENKKTRAEILEEFSDGHSYTVREVRERVDAELRKDGKGTRNQAQKTFVSMQVSLNGDFRKQVKELAKLTSKRPEVLLRELVEEYFEEFRAHITRRLKKQKAADKSKLGRAA